MRARAFRGFVAVLLAPAAVAAQIVTGRVVDSASRRPLARVAVRLIPASDSVRDTTYASSETAADGVFSLAAPSPGRYRVRLGEHHVGPVVALGDADVVDEHQYVVGAAPTPATASPVVPASASLEADPVRVYDEKETQQHARLLRNDNPPVPSESMVRRVGLGSGPMNYTWRATAECIVGVDGRCESGSMRVVTTTDPEYADLLRDYFAHATFAPARVGARVVRQRVQIPFALQARTTVRPFP